MGLAPRTEGTPQHSTRAGSPGEGWCGGGCQSAQGRAGAPASPALAADNNQGKRDALSPPAYPQPPSASATDDFLRLQKRRMGSTPSRSMSTHEPVPVCARRPATDGRAWHARTTLRLSHLHEDLALSRLLQGVKLVSSKDPEQNSRRPVGGALCAFWELALGGRLMRGWLLEARAGHTRASAGGTSGVADFSPARSKLTQRKAAHLNLQPGGGDLVVGPLRGDVLVAHHPVQDGDALGHNQQVSLRGGAARSISRSQRD